MKEEVESGGGHWKLAAGIEMELEIIIESVASRSGREVGRRCWEKQQGENCKRKM